MNVHCLEAVWYASWYRGLVPLEATAALSHGLVPRILQIQNKSNRACVLLNLLHHLRFIASDLFLYACFTSWHVINHIASLAYIIMAFILPTFATHMSVMT